MGPRRIARSPRALRAQLLHDNDGSKRATASTTCTLALRGWRISLLMRVNPRSPMKNSLLTPLFSSPTSNWEHNLSHTRFPGERTFTSTMGNSPSTRS